MFGMEKTKPIEKTKPGIFFRVYILTASVNSVVRAIQVYVIKSCKYCTNPFTNWM